MHFVGESGNCPQQVFVSSHQRNLIYLCKCHIKSVADTDTETLTILEGIYQEPWGISGWNIEREKSIKAPACLSVRNVVIGHLPPQTAANFHGEVIGRHEVYPA